MSGIVSWRQLGVSLCRNLSAVVLVYGAQDRPNGPTVLVSEEP